MFRNPFRPSLEEMCRKQFISNYTTGSGFIEHASTRDVQEDSSMWELRIAINPTQENLKNATRLLAPLFAKAKLRFKFLALNRSDGNNNIDDVSKLKWDGTSANGLGDRDQRGKECCIFIRRDRRDMQLDNYEITPQQIKELMLQALKILIDNDVQFGYVGAPPGDEALAMPENLPSLFSCAAARPWRGGMGILLPSEYKREAAGLLAKDRATLERYQDIELQEGPTHPILPLIEELPTHNPLRFRSPFAGIDITPADLERHKIDKLKLIQIGYERKKYLKEHSAKTRIELVTELDGCQGEPHNIEEKIRVLNTGFPREGSVEDKIRFIRDNNRLFLQLFDLIPMDFNTTADFHDSSYVAELKHFLDQCIPGAPAQQQAAAVARIATLLAEPPIADIMRSIERIKSYYQNHLSFPDRDIIASIESQPRKMQRLFPRIIHLNSETDALVNERERLKNFAAEHKAYRKILVPIFEAISLLDSNDPSQNKLRTELQALARELNTSCVEKVVKHQGALTPELRQTYEDAKQLAKSIPVMVGSVLNRSKEEGIKEVKDFEDNARQLQTFKKSTFKNVLRQIGRVVIAAVGAVLGCVVGAAVEGTVLAVMSSHAMGALGVFGVFHGAVKGSITGWTVGLLGATALGLAGGGYTAKQVLKGNDRVDNVTEAAKEVSSRPRNN